MYCVCYILYDTDRTRPRRAGNGIAVDLGAKFLILNSTLPALILYAIITLIIKVLHYFDGRSILLLL